MKQRIFVIDDEKNARFTIETSLHGLGYDLYFAENGIQALKTIDAIDPDLILLDVMMPDMTGYEVCSRIRESSASKEVPIVFLTSLDDKQSLFRGFEAGGDDFITKPFNRIELIVRINGILRLNRFRKLLGERKKFQWLVDQAEEGYISTNESFELLYANESAQRLLSLSEYPLKNPTNFKELITKNFDLKPTSDWEELFHGHPPKETLYFIKPETPQHSSQWFELIFLPESMDNHRFYQIKDVTTNVELTMEVKKFHNIVSHKLNTPMNHILPFLELSLMSLDDGDYEEVREHITCARNGALDLHQQIQRILQLLGPRNASIHRFLPMNQLKDLVLDVANSHSIDPNHVSFDIRAEPSCNLSLSLQNLHSILHELIWNAVKNHPSNQPYLTVTVFCDKDKQEARMILKNNGTSLAIQELRSVNHFFPYFQGEKYFTGQKEGMGLGLNGIKTMIWNVGGRFKLRNSSDENGVEAVIVIPSCQQCCPED